MIFTDSNMITFLILPSNTYSWSLTTTSLTLVLGTLHRAAEYLPSGGLLVLITRGTECAFPMWKELKSRVSYTAKEFEEPMINAGFKVQITREVDDKGRVVQQKNLQFSLRVYWPRDRGGIKGTRTRPVPWHRELGHDQHQRLLMPQSSELMMKMTIFALKYTASSTIYSNNLTEMLETDWRQTAQTMIYTHTSMNQLIICIVQQQ